MTAIPDRAERLYARGEARAERIAERGRAWADRQGEADGQLYALLLAAYASSRRSSSRTG
jgi:hypothetical protein